MRPPVPSGVVVSILECKLVIDRTLGSAETESRSWTSLGIGKIVEIKYDTTELEVSSKRPSQPSAGSGWWTRTRNWADQPAQAGQSQTSPLSKQCGS